MVRGPVPLIIPDKVAVVTPPVAVNVFDPASVIALGTLIPFAPKLSWVDADIARGPDPKALLLPRERVPEVRLVPTE